MLDDELRLAALLRDPRETLDTEIKDWLDLGSRDHQALLAKAAIALANHGGGFILVGFTQTGDGFVPGGDRPQSLAAFNQDAINGIVHRYAEPPFHCDLRIVLRPGTDELFPVIVVPGGHRVPIRSKRDGPSGQRIQKDVYYIRRPGPQSASPQSSQEWDNLVQRCVRAGREHLMGGIRDILAGRVPERSSPDDEQMHALVRWADNSISRWQNLIEELPPESQARCPRGFWWAAYAISGVVKPLRGGELLDVMSTKRIRHTGCPPWWVPPREGIRAYPQDDGIECWVGGDPEQPPRDPETSDFWRASPKGLFFLLRGYQEDGANIGPDRPGTIFSVVAPIWHVGECLLHAADMAREVGSEDANVLFRVHWTGLQQRWLRAPNRYAFWEPRQWKSDKTSVSSKVLVDADKINDSLVEIVQEILTPLYEKFDFYKPPIDLIQNELELMLSRRL